MNFLVNTQMNKMNQFVQNMNKQKKNLNKNFQKVEWFTFSPQYHEVFEAFNQIVRTQSKQITTVNQVKKFVEHCFNNAYDKANKEFDIDDMYACVCETNIPDDTIIVIEFED